MARQDDDRTAAVAAQPTRREAERSRRHRDDALDGGRHVGCPPQRRQHFEGQRRVDVTAAQARVGEQAAQRALEPAHVPRNGGREPRGESCLERKPEGYWWGIDTTIETKIKPIPPKPAEGSAAGSGSWARCVTNTANA